MESQNITCEKCNKEVALASSELHKRRCEPKKLQTAASPISIVAQNFDANQFLQQLTPEQKQQVLETLIIQSQAQQQPVQMIQTQQNLREPPQRLQSMQQNSAQNQNSNSLARFEQVAASQASNPSTSQSPSLNQERSAFDEDDDISGYVSVGQNQDQVWQQAQARVFLAIPKPRAQIEHNQDQIWQQNYDRANQTIPEPRAQRQPSQPFVRQNEDLDLVECRFCKEMLVKDFTADHICAAQQNEEVKLPCEICNEVYNGYENFLQHLDTHQDDADGSRPQDQPQRSQLPHQRPSAPISNNSRLSQAHQERLRMQQLLREPEDFVEQFRRSSIDELINPFQGDYLNHQRMRPNQAQPYYLPRDPFPDPLMMDPMIPQLNQDFRQQQFMPPFSGMPMRDHFPGMQMRNPMGNFDRMPSDMRRPPFGNFDEILGSEAAPLNVNVLDQLPQSEFKMSELSNNATEAEKQCIVCLGDYEDGDKVLTLTCFHKFHYSCIVEWFKTKDSCPVCRVKIQGE